MKRQAFKIKIATAFMALGTTNMFAQAASSTQSGLDMFGNQVYLGLTVVAILLLVIIAVLSSTLKGLGRQQTNIQVKNHEGQPVVEQPQIKTTWVRGASVIAFTLFAQQAFAAERIGDVLQTPKAPVIDWVVMVLLAFIVFEFAVIMLLISSVKKMMVANGLIADAVVLKEVAFEAKVQKARKPTFMNKWLTRAVPIEKEAAITFDHEYDGIRELDNALPPWWLYGFYLSILFGVIYLFHYHVLGTGELSAAELKTEYAVAEAERNQLMKEMAAAGEVMVNEENVTVLTDAASIASGKATYEGMCITCHGDKGQGLIGPNLTDEYWIYGGSIKNIFKIVTNGTQNGMQSWKSQLSPKTIQEVGSYIKSLNGSKPAGAKAPQGNLYTEVVEVKTDSTATAIADTIK